ncbi:MAG: radical SAM protein [Sphingomonadales bacterium]
MDAIVKQSPLFPEKFRDPIWTAKGERRASVGLRKLDTLWFNTGTLCNLACANCYIESSPTNNRLVYLTAAEVAAYLDEIELLGWPVREIGFTGGEPFMNPDTIDMIDMCLMRGYSVLVLTNAMRPMEKVADRLAAVRDKHGNSRLAIRVSIDHYTQAIHERERGPRAWRPMIDGLKWLTGNGFTVHAAGRIFDGEPESALRAGYARLFTGQGIAIDAYDPRQLVLFPEIDDVADVPEITTECWDILGIHPGDMMCATSRMVVKREGAGRPTVVACTLLPYDQRFEMGDTLAQANRTVSLNHAHCAQFCVLGGGSCSAAGS